MSNNTHCVIDLETTSTNPARGRILSIGLAIGRPDNDGDIVAEEIRVRSDDIVNLHEEDDEGTLAWWHEVEMSGEAGMIAYSQAFFSEDAVHIEDALVWLNEKLKEHDVRYVWGNGSSFDISFLDRFYYQTQIKPHYKYGNVRDMRTLMHLARSFGVKKESFEFPEGMYRHVASHDAIHEYHMLAAAWQAIKKGAKNA